jgi:putative transcriptional regulator
MQAAKRISIAAGLALAAAVLGPGAAARAADPAAEPVILVAKPQLRDRLYGATILIAKPIGNNQHIGLIVNKPTRFTLGRLFPDHAPSQKVTDPVYLGGPFNTRMIFALVKRSKNPGSHSLQITPELYLATEREIVDRIIEDEPEHARFFAGFVCWEPGELSSELKRGFWYVLDVDPSIVLRKPTEGLWEELIERSQREANTI